MTGNRCALCGRLAETHQARGGVLNQEPLWLCRECASTRQDDIDTWLGGGSLSKPTMTGKDGGRMLRNMDTGSVDDIRAMLVVIGECQGINPKAANDARKALRKAIAHRRHIPSWGSLPTDLREQVERALQEGADGS